MDSSPQQPTAATTTFAAPNNTAATNSNTAANTTSLLDLEALLSREYRPALVTRLIPQDKYKHPSTNTAGAGVKKDDKQKTDVNNSNQDEAAAKKRQMMKEETSRLVLSLVAETPTYQRHHNNGNNSAAGVVGSVPHNKIPHLVKVPPSFRTRSSNHYLTGGVDDDNTTTSSPSYSNSQQLLLNDVLLGDWESEIDWDGNLGRKQQRAAMSASTNGLQQPPHQPTTKDLLDPMSLLQQPRNHHLDHIILDESVWNVDPHAQSSQKQLPPLILELGVAGRSVAKQIYQNLQVQAQRPTPALQSDAYRKRFFGQFPNSSSNNAAAEGEATSKSSSSLLVPQNKDEQKKLVAARQKQRARMAVEKTTRVTEAMGALSSSNIGRGRTVTSSLMGPGGTERTGRPSRTFNSGILEYEYIEQLDLINNHNLVRGDWSKILLRQLMRPKLPMSVVRPGPTTWQFQIRYIPKMGAGSKGSKDSRGGAGSSGGGQSSSYQAIMMGTHAGAISKERLRNEADLSPTEGKLVLMEYVEERPPVQLTKGMCSKIINYYRGDKSRCPVSAGGGDRPARRKRAGGGSDRAATSGSGSVGLANDGGGGGGGVGGAASSANSKHGGGGDRLPRLVGPNRPTNIMDWVGKIPKKSQKDRSDEQKEAMIDVMPEGVTEVLHPKVHGPFIGGVDEGMVVTGLISNLFVAPMFRHEPEPTDFLMILTPPGGASRPGQREAMGVILRDLPSSVFTVGQTEPRTKVHAPGSQGEKNFLNPFVSYQIARSLTRSQARDGHGLRFDEIQDRVLPSYDLPANSLRQRLKQVAIFDKTTSIWTTKAIGYEDYIGVDALGRSIVPESIAAFESAGAARRRLQDLGIEVLTEKGAHTVVSVGVTMVYLAGQLNAAREISRKTRKLGELSKSNKSVQPLQLKLYEKASEELDMFFKSLRQKHEVAQYIYEELQLAPWHLTREFIDVHKKGEGTGMMKLTGLGDPSGQGAGFSFLREVDSKPSKSVGSGALNADIKKITGTEDDLRKLTMKQMAALLRSYGMGQKQIDTLKRWDRVHVIRDLSTKAASDGIGDGLERFARGEKMKLSEQKEMYSQRIKVIWKRQIASLSASGDREAGGADVDDGESAAVPGSETATQKKAADTEKEESDSDSDDEDDFAAALESEMADRSEANQLVAAHATTGEGAGGNLGQLRAAAQDQDLTKDARELAALKRQREEERIAKEGLKSMNAGDGAAAPGSYPADRKVIRKRITKTHPDGRQTTTFKFILHPEEVGKIMGRLQQDPESGRPRNLVQNYEHGVDEKPPCHAMFEDEDDFEYSSKGRMVSGRRRGGSRRKGGGGRGGARARNLQLGKLKTKTSTEERMRKRKKEEEERDVYVTSAKRKGTSNRRERGSIRDRRAHVIFAEKLEAIRQVVESRPMAGPFLKAVNRKIFPRYYEVISHPIHLAAIRSKISDFQYRTADAFVQDFELMKKNAIKFNGPASPIALEAVAIYDLVKNQVEASRKELTQLEAEVIEVMSGKPKKKKQKTQKKTTAKTGTSGSVASVGGVSVNLGDISSTVQFDGSDSDSDDSLDDMLGDL